jgi:DNA-directed RNA polymerase specialized sigma24 family protein
MKTATTDEQLLAAYVRGDQASFTELVNRYQEPLERYVTALGLEPDDIVQAAFIYINQNGHGFIPGQDFKHWLYKTVESLVHEQKAANKQAAAVRASPEFEVMAEAFQR